MPSSVAPPTEAGEGTLFYPATSGGMQWGGGAVDPGAGVRRQAADDGMAAAADQRRDLLEALGRQSDTVERARPHGRLVRNRLQSWMSTILSSWATERTRLTCPCAPRRNSF